MILPFAIDSTAVFVFRQFFLQLPRALFDAARMDGAGELTILLRIAVPLSKPALITAVLLTFIWPGNEFLFPAGACMLAGPAVAPSIAFQRHFVSSNLGSGV